MLPFEYGIFLSGLVIFSWVSCFLCVWVLLPNYLWSASISSNMETAYSSLFSLLPHEPCYGWAYFSSWLLGSGDSEQQQSQPYSIIASLGEVLTDGSWAELLLGFSFHRADALSCSPLPSSMQKTLISKSSTAVLSCERSESVRLSSGTLRLTRQPCWNWSTLDLSSKSLVSHQRCSQK